MWRKNEPEPEDSIVDGDHDDDRAPEGHEGGEEGVGEVGVEDAQAGVFTDCRFPRPDDFPGEKRPTEICCFILT